MSSAKLQQRAAGVLMHLSCLPDDLWIGDLGRQAFDFAAVLKASGLKWWQLLPLNPIGPGNSPYSSISAFATEPLYIDPDELAEAGFIDRKLLQTLNKAPSRRAAVNYRQARNNRQKVWRQAYRRWHQTQGFEQQEFKAFCDAQRFWLDDYALFQVITEDQGHADWSRWPKELRDRKPRALKNFRTNAIERIRYHLFLQFLFQRQWDRFRQHCHNLNVHLIGDMPFFVGLASADVWAHRNLFQVEESGQPKAVAGVPPDAFSDEGQLWGSALYEWRAHKAEGFRWWAARLNRQLALFDALRLDHFIGFYRYWAVPRGAKTAKNGQWRRSAGAELFARLQKEQAPVLNQLIAEDLGAMIPEVTELRQRFGLPGMKVLQFGFGDEGGREYLPHNFEPHFIAYPGTHDNNTALGWFQSLSAPVQAEVCEYLRCPAAQVHWGMIHGIFASVARLAIIPMQDFLGLGSAARMNAPGTVGKHWQWRLPRTSKALQSKIQRLCSLFDR